MSEVCNLTLQKRNREKLKEEILLLSGNEWLRVSCLFSKKEKPLQIFIRSRRRSRAEVSEAPDIGPHLPDLRPPLICTSETPEPVASRSKVGGDTGVSR